MIQQELIFIENSGNIMLIHDDTQFTSWLQECASILTKAQNIASTSLKVVKAEAEYHKYSITVEDILDNKGLREGKMVLDYSDLLRIVPLDKNQNLDLVNITDKEKYELQKFLIKRLWDYYKYGKKFFKA